MNRTVKNATIKSFHGPGPDRPEAHNLSSWNAPALKSSSVIMRPVMKRSMFAQDSPVSSARAPLLACP